MFRGREIRRLILVSALCCIVLALSVSLYMILSSRNNLKEQTDRMKAALAVNIGEHQLKCFESMNESLLANEGINMGSGLTDLLANKKALYDLFAFSVMAFTDAEFAAYYNGEVLLASKAKPGVDVPGPDVVPSGGREYEMVGQLGEEQGSFFLFNKKGIIPGDRVVYAIDNTAQIEAMKTAYEDEKSSMMTEQIIVVGVIFLVLLAGSLLLIKFLINRWIGSPMDRLNGEARSIMAGRRVEEQEVREGSLFANLQGLINSGRAIFAGSGREASPADGHGKSAGRREVNKVMALWAVVITGVFLLGTIAILVFSISIMNSKSDAIVEEVSNEMIVFYNEAYDSLTKSSLGGGDAYIGKDIFNPGATIDREKSIKALADIIRSSFASEAAVSYLEKDGRGFHLASVKGDAALDYKPVEMGESFAVYHGFLRQGDMVLVTMNGTDYPGYGDNQFTYVITDLSPQAEVLEGLYQDGSSSLLTIQLILLFAFLALAILASSISMAWGVRKYITRPILELDAMSNRVIEGDLYFEIVPDEDSGFADMQRLLKKAQEQLRSMGE